jgi:hypothetical protein
VLLRRLLWLVAALLLVAAATSALAPREDDDGKSGTTTTAPATTRPARETATVTEELKTGANPQKPVRARVGDHVVLSVTADRDGTATIEGLDRLEPVSEFTPARFDFVASRTGVFPIVLTSPREPVGELRISDAAQPPG